MQVEVVGSIKEANFHVAKCAAEVTRYKFELWNHNFYFPF